MTETKTLQQDNNEKDIKFIETLIGLTVNNKIKWISDDSYQYSFSTVSKKNNKCTIRLSYLENKENPIIWILLYDGSNYSLLYKISTQNKKLEDRIKKLWKVIIDIYELAYTSILNELDSLEKSIREGKNG